MVFFAVTKSKESSGTTPCPRCKEPASGRFCVGCGAALQAEPCASCKQPISPGARFCHHCGAAAGAAEKGSGMPPAWALAASVIVVLAAFIAGQQFASPKAGTGSAESAAAAPFAGGGPAGRAPDISNMTPEEAANRLFDRVMRYATEGKADSAAMFAPMAILAYERIGPPDAHARYDMGTISAVIGDVDAAKAQADTVLKAQPNHLLALLLAARAADAGKDAAGAARFRARFTAALTAERAKNLREYTDHQQEIDAAVSRKP